LCLRKLVKLLNRGIDNEGLMKNCSICHKISATGEDHIDCMQKRKVELEDEYFKQKIPEKLDMAKNMEELSIEIRALLEHITKRKENKVE